MFWFVLRQKTPGSEGFENLLPDLNIPPVKKSLGGLNETNRESEDSNTLRREVDIRIASLTINCLSFAFAC